MAFSLFSTKARLFVALVLITSATIRSQSASFDLSSARKSCNVAVAAGAGVAGMHLLEKSGGGEWAVSMLLDLSKKDPAMLAVIAVYCTGVYALGQKVNEGITNLVADGSNDTQKDTLITLAASVSAMGLTAAYLCH